MVKIKFYGLIRSNHRVTEMQVKPGTLRKVLDQIQAEHPTMTDHELMTAIIFVNQKKVMHLNRLSTLIHDGDEIVFTNFVGGG